MGNRVPVKAETSGDAQLRDRVFRIHVAEGLAGTHTLILPSWTASHFSASTEKAHVEPRALKGGAPAMTFR